MRIGSPQGQAVFFAMTKSKKVSDNTKIDPLYGEMDKFLESSSEKLKTLTKGQIIEVFGFSYIS